MRQIMMIFQIKSNRLIWFVVKNIIKLNHFPGINGDLNQFKSNQISVTVPTTDIHKHGNWYIHVPNIFYIHIHVNCHIPKGYMVYSQTWALSHSLGISCIFTDIGITTFPGNILYIHWHWHYHIPREYLVYS